MGYYIRNNSAGASLHTVGKIVQLMLDGADIVDEEKLVFQPNLICVVEIGPYEEVHYVYSEHELNRLIAKPQCFRTWLTYAPAAELSGYKEQQSIWELI